MKRFSLILACSFGCASDDPQDDDAQTTESGGLGDDTSCEPGSPGCECVGGMCLAPLVCIANACGWPAPDEGGEDGSDDSGESSDDGVEPPPSCGSDDDCPSGQGCTQAGECLSAWEFAYDMTVTNWTPTSCSEGGLSGSADLWWALYLDDGVAASSNWVQGGCPGHWTETVCIESGVFAAAFVLALYDEDNLSSELFDQLWWDAGGGYADFLPAQILIDGHYDGPSNAGGDVSIDFVRAESCL